MPRCNLTLKQKCHIIELSGQMTTEVIAKKFHVHPTTITRTLQKKTKILEQASRVNCNFKTVQTNQRGEEHDSMVLNYIRERQANHEPLTIKDICDKAVEFAGSLDRNIKSKRGWWRRFKTRCNIVRSKLPKGIKSPNESVLNSDKALKNKTTNKSKNKGYTFKIKENITTNNQNVTTTSGTKVANGNSDSKTNYSPRKEMNSSYVMG